MVAKVNQDEIYSELNFRAVVISIFTLILILITGLGFLFIYYRNIAATDRKNKEELEKRVIERTAELSEAHSHLEMLNNELEAFSYSVSHDLRAPLRAITGFSNQLSDELEKSEREDILAIVKDITQTTRHMEKLINDLLEFSRLSRKEIKKDLIDMNMLFKNTCKELMSVNKRKDIKFNFNNVPDAYGDISLIKQVILNLISNAIKFSGKEEFPEITISGEQSDSENIYSIADNGVGFNKNYTHKLFKVFQRLHSSREFEGTGVGLAIVQRIISRHGGRIWAESKINEGAVFYFTLPVYPGTLINEKV